MNERKIKLLIDVQPYSTKPDNKETSFIQSRLNDNPPIREVAISQLLELIGKGHTIIPAVLKDGTKNENWIQQELIPIDIDNKDKKEKILTPDEAISLLKEKNIDVLAYYYTFSSSASKPKFRLLLLLDKPVTNPNEMEFIIQSLIDYIPQADQSCNNLARLFYGTNKELKMLNPEATITIEDIIRLNPPRLDVSQNKSNDTELGKLITDFDLLEYMKQENEISHRSSNCTYFKTCSICGHKDCLRYYHNTNSFYCFGANGSVGGSIIDYIKATKSLDTKEAVNYFLYDILKKPRTIEAEQRKSKPLQTISAIELHNKELKPIKFIVDNMLPQGLNLIASPPKYRQELAYVRSLLIGC